jgi:E3 ubiquitin-protein ligase UBR4
MYNHHTQLRENHDAPFTTNETFFSNEELTITDGSSMPSVDFIEVYGQAKNVFGWKKKMNVVLHMEACDMGSTADAKSLKRPQTMQIGCY